MDRSPAHLWFMRAGFVALAFVIMFFHLIPLDTVPRRWAPPDLLVAFAFAWALRRPDYVPALSIAGVMLMADLMFQRPPGLMAMLVLLGAEYLKNRSAGLSEASFAGEWVAVNLALVGITVLNRVTLTVLAVDQAPLALSVIQMLATMAVYPIVVIITQTLMNVRKLAPGDSDALGGRA
ncbi:MAG: rod shape-determining protein MreD [Sedimentitalea sp.]